MCGILGLVGGRVDAKCFDRAVDILEHRGPDDRGVEVLREGDRGDVRFGFRRLAIIDLSPGGHQPMFDERRERCIVFNGEIYNYQSIRRELERKGHRFRSSSDTEVILAAYREWGPEALQRFIGMFAIAIWDSKDETLFIARDRLGIKPLFYHHDGGRFAFASEVKALLALPGVPRELNDGALPKYLAFLEVPAPETMFRGINQLLPGHYAILRRGSLAVTQYWDVPLGGEEGGGSDPYVRLGELLTDSVRLRLVSDVPVGAFLSGGVDSTLIVGLMREIGGAQRVITQTVTYTEDDQRHDIEVADAPYAREARDFFGDLDYHEILSDPDVVSLLPKVVWHMDDPIADPAAIATFLICRAAKEHATVMLSGMGAEELFGGYRRYRAATMADMYQRAPSWARAATRAAVSRLPASRPGPFLALARNAKKFLSAAELPFEERYLRLVSHFGPAELTGLLTNPAPVRDLYSTHRPYLEKAAGLHPIKRSTYLDLKTFLPNHNLAYTDRGSMAASIEVRVPIIDHRIVEFVRTLPTRELVHGSKQKYVLKRTAERVVPRSIVWREKSGFGLPIRSWLKRQLRPLVSELLSEATVRNRGFFEPAAVRRLMDDVWAGREDNAVRIWALLTMEIWARTYLDSDGLKPATL
jgi:asparagine synthase (glutamine-hydrolysing)